MKGFSARNLKYMRMFAEAWSGPEIVQQPVAQLPWGHNLVLLTKLKTRESRLAYAQKTLQYGWSRNVLVMQIESNLIEREGKAITNFNQSLPKPQSDLAIESLKYPYRFDFLSLGKEAQERDIENALVQHVTDFLLELGAGFAFVGKQVNIEDKPTIGLLLCKSKNKVVAEYALGDKTQPMGIAEYALREALPENLEANLPSIEQIEHELRDYKNE